MKRVNQIYQNPRYQAYLKKIEEFEEERIFCGHDIKHFLDVARIGYIMSLEGDMKIDKELIYGFGLLHDIGRWCQYETGEPHDKASARLAKDILKETDYSEDETNKIIAAILAHRSKKTSELDDFNEIMYRADKASRACFSCKERVDCNWSDEKKNLTIAF